jgi:hypothetical protein
MLVAVEAAVGPAGTPPDMIAGMHQSSTWTVFEVIAPTLAHDAACVNGGAS